MPGAVFGGVGGFMQSIDLKCYIAKSPYWILASILSWAGIWALFWGCSWAWVWGTIDQSHELFATVSIGILWKTIVGLSIQSCLDR
jgi:hypothetical protein